MWRGGAFSLNMHIYVFLMRDFFITTTEVRRGEYLGVGSIHVATLPSCQYIKLLHYDCINMNIIG